MLGWSRRKRVAVLRDPVRSPGGLHEVSRMRRGIGEFLRLPLLLTALFCVAGVAIAVLDAVATETAPLRGTAAGLVPGDGAVDFVSAVATSVVTVTSITFSVLLLAVQQTANSLTAVVFDQFLRRVTNQVYSGFFVGLSAYCFIVLGAARQYPEPVYGAALTLVLTVGALVVLLVLIHGTIDQMRPQSVVRSIHELALRARERELSMMGRTRAWRHSDACAEERLVTVPDTGYVTSIDLDALAELTRSTGEDAETIVEATLGHYLTFGDVLVRLVGVAPDDDSRDDETRQCFWLDDIRDVDIESGYATDQLGNICWAAASSAQQNPQTAITALRSLRDLLIRWLEAAERDRSERPAELPIVYPDGAVPRVLGSLANLLVGTTESRQAQTCAEAVQAFAGIARRLRTDHDRAVFDEALNSGLPAVVQHAEVPSLKVALRELQDVLTERGHDVFRVAEVRHQLSEATDRLLPKPADEPAAAHPRVTVTSLPSGGPSPTGRSRARPGSRSAGRSP